MTSEMKTGELQAGYGYLSDEEYQTEIGKDMQHKPVLDAKVEKLVRLMKVDDDIDFISAWVKYPFWEGRLNVNLGAQ